jgi:hypothetical protein
MAETHEAPPLTTRRKFVAGAAFAATAVAAKWATGTSAQGATTQAVAPAKRHRRLLTPEQFRARLEGPVQSGASPFTADFGVDYAGVRNMVARGLRYGIRVFAMTAGNGQYHALEQNEIRGIAAAMVEAASDEAIVIAATGDWWTGLTVDFARYSDAIGADAVQGDAAHPRGERVGDCKTFRSSGGGNEAADCASRSIFRAAAEKAPAGRADDRGDEGGR